VAASPAGFAPPWWGRNRHLQTVWGPLVRRARLRLRRERLPLSDGDFVDLDWLDGRPGSPVLLVLHGLEGSAGSHYAVGLLAGWADRGGAGVVLNFRSCSGELNSLPRFYHSGDTGDLDTVVRGLARRAPETPLAAVGVSLGGNVLLKWLGEQGAGARALAAAVAISVPFDLAASARILDRGLARAVYTRDFLRTLRAKVLAKARRFPGFVDVAAVRRARTFAAYDRVVTAPLHGFADEHDYWARSSSRPYLGRIVVPTLLLGARDDPFVPPESLPDPGQLPPTVQAEFSARGGHAGFLEGRWPWRVRSWAERRAVEFVAARVAERRPA
jgi:predicted alpha/beta-fold hydrolase